MDATLVTELAAGMSAVLDQALTVEDLLESARSDTPLPAERLRPLHELGLHDLFLGEDQGGFGADHAAAVVLATVGGRKLLPSLLRVESAVAVPALAAWEGVEDLLDGVRASRTPVGIVLVHKSGVLESSAPGRITLPPTLALVPPEASTLVVLSRDACAVVDVLDDGVLVTPADGNLDPGQHLATVALREAAVRGGARPDAGEPRSMWERAVLGTLGEALGCAETALDLSVGYAQTREQFGRPIGTFQAVAHRLARMRADLEACRSLLGRVVDSIGQGEQALADDLILSAIHWIPARTRQIVEGSVQVHGGIGFTWEFGLHLYLRRVLALQALLGGHHESARVAGLAYSGRLKRPA